MPRSLAVVSRRHTPEVRSPSPQDEEDKNDEQRHTDLPVPHTCLSVLKLYSPIVDNLALCHALLLSPLQLSQIHSPVATRKQGTANDDRPSGKEDITLHNVIIRVIITVLYDTSNNAYEDRHAVVDSDLDRVARTEDLLVPHRGANGIDDDSGPKRGCDSIDTEGCSCATNGRTPCSQAHRE